MAWWTSELYRRWDVLYVHNCTEGPSDSGDCNINSARSSEPLRREHPLRRAGRSAPSRFRSAARHFGNRRRQRHFVGSGWWLLMQNNVKQRSIHLQSTVVLDEAKLSKLVHEEIHSCAVVPTISASVCWLIWGTTVSVVSSFPKRDRIKRARARRFSLELNS